MSLEPLKLEDWQKHLEQLATSPFVGSRPQSPADGPEMLIGRKADLERICRAVLERPLVILDGDSGVGKTSLLQNGLYKELEALGYGVFVAQPRSDEPPAPQGHDARWNDESLENYLIALIEKTHDGKNFPTTHRAPLQGEGSCPGKGYSLSDKRDQQPLCATLDEAYQETGAVLIIDQFEELLRQNLDFAAQLVGWVLRVIRSNDTRIVISLRRDSLYRLDDLLRGVKPFSLDRVRIDPITDRESIRQIIATEKKSWREEKGVSDNYKAIAPDAVEELLRLWLDRSGPTKLLDLQATLYALFHRGQMRNTESGQEVEYSFQEGTPTVTIDEVSRLVKEASEAEQVDVFAFGLEESFRLKFQHAERAAREKGLDDYLVLGAREVVKNSLPHLSSGDHKVPINELMLLRRAMKRELDVLGYDHLSDGIIGGMLERLRADPKGATKDILTTKRVDVIEDFGSAIAELQGKRKVPERVTAGPLMACEREQVLVEELRRAAFAIDWLEQTTTVHRNDNGDLNLVHDGAGRALNKWAEETQTGSEEVFHRLTASIGERFEWGNVESKERDDYRVVANANLRECHILGTSFRRVVFVNCDFSAARFTECVFEGVTFVNCLLDDANIEDCTIVGAFNQQRIGVDNKDPDKLRFAPSFLIGVPERMVKAFANYRDEDEPGSSLLFSDTSGVAALPGDPPENFRGKVIAQFGGEARSDNLERVVATSGSVAMVGGRLCFLTLYRCRSKDGGGFVFHHVSGGGLDIVGQQGGSVTIYDGAVRGVSITTDTSGSVNTSGEASNTHRIQFNADQSTLVHTLIADGVQGEAEISNCKVFMLLNASGYKKDGFRVELKGCRWQFLVNTELGENPGREDSRPGEKEESFFKKAEGEAESRFGTVDCERLALLLGKMDYRLHPEKWERQQREPGGKGA